MMMANSFVHRDPKTHYLFVLSQYQSVPSGHLKDKVDLNYVVVNLFWMGYADSVTKD